MSYCLVLFESLHSDIPDAGIIACSDSRDYIEFIKETQCILLEEDDVELSIEEVPECSVASLQAKYDTDYNFYSLVGSGYVECSIEPELLAVMYCTDGEFYWDIQFDWELYDDFDEVIFTTLLTSTTYKEILEEMETLLDPYRVLVLTTAELREIVKQHKSDWDLARLILN